MNDAGIFRFLKLKGQLKPTRILLVDGNSGLIDRINAILGSNENSLLIQRVGSTKLALDHLQKYATDLVITEFHRGRIFDLSFINSLRDANPDLKVLVMSTHDEIRFVNEVLVTGVHGYILKKDLDKELSAAVKNVMAGKRFVSSELNKLLVHLIDGSYEAG